MIRGAASAVWPDSVLGTYCTSVASSEAVDRPEDTDAAHRLLTENGIDRSSLARLLHADAEIVEMTATLVGTGQVGENVRCRLAWSDPAAGPERLVVKLASSNEHSRNAAATTRTYIREVGFYRDLAAHVAIRVPRPFHVSEDRAANRFVLVMEDIDPARAGDQLSGCTPEQASIAVEAAADLHGSTWQRSGRDTPDLGQFDWLDPVGDDRISDRAELFRALHPGFEAIYRDALTADEIAFGRLLRDRFEDHLEQQFADGGADECLIHGDFRPDNMLFGAGAGVPPVTTVDWQTVSRGRGVGDVAYFLSGALPRTRRKELEPDLLARYRSRLADHGVEIAPETLWQRYVQASPAGYVMAVIASQLVGRTDRGDEMFMVMARGSIHQSLELGVPDLLNG